MALTLDEIKNIAKLARLEITNDEAEKFAHELSVVVNYFGKLSQLNTTQVDLNAAVGESAKRIREDEAMTPKDQEKILDNAPLREDRYIKVKSVL